MATDTPSKSSRKIKGREKLLQAANELAHHHGISDIPLRQLATELGTSHRMLLYYFESKEGLMAELMKAKERDSMRFFNELRANQEISPKEKLWQFWRFIVAPEREMGARLWIEVFSQALGGRGYAGELLPTIIESWVEPLSYICEQMGSPPEKAAADGRIVLGAVHGLALQLTATHNREAADEAFHRVLELLERGNSKGEA